MANAGRLVHVLEIDLGHAGNSAGRRGEAEEGSAQAQRQKIRAAAIKAATDVEMRMAQK